MADSVVQNLVAEIRNRAHQRGLSDADLARQAGMTPPAFSRLHRSGGARIDTIDALARAVDLRIGLLPDDDHARALAEGTLFNL